MERLHTIKGLRTLLFGFVASVIAAFYIVMFGVRVGAQESTDLSVYQVASHYATLPMGATSAPASTVQQGNRLWNVFLNNNSQTAVTNASVTVHSGYDPALFRWGSFDPLTGFPSTKTVASLQPGQQWEPSTISSDIADSFAPGYDSTRTVSPAAIPAGGGQQTVTVTLRPVDPRFAPDSGVCANVVLTSEVPGMTVVATTDPNNLNEGEILNQLGNPSDSHQWQLCMLRLNKQYTFTATLQVPNNTGAPLTYQPSINIRDERATLIADGATGQSVTVTEPTLDGTTPGAGQITYAVAETDRVWVVKHSESWDVIYPGTPAPVEPMHVDMIVNPGTGDPALVIPGRLGLVTVVIPGTSGLDVTMLGQIKFGKTGTEASPLLTKTLDINRDGRKDKAMIFSTSQAGITCSTKLVTLIGKYAMDDIVGSAAIRTLCR